MSNSFYNRVFNLTDHVDYLTAATVKNEFALIEAGFDKFPALAGNGGKLVAIKADETGLEAINVAVAASSLSTSGYYVFPSSPNDLIFQWGTGTSNATGDVSITLATTFPNAILHALVGASDSGGWATSEAFAWGVDFTACTTSTVVADVRKLAGSADPTNAATGKVCRCLAWGY
jgi:hypothetical protein